MSFGDHVIFIGDYNGKENKYLCRRLASKIERSVKIVEARLKIPNATIENTIDQC